MENIDEVACGEQSARVRWQGRIESVQCRAWVWRYAITHEADGVIR